MSTSVREHLLRQAGVISLSQARAAGLTQRQVEHRMKTGEWLTVDAGCVGCTRRHHSPRPRSGPPSCGPDRRRG